MKIALIDTLHANIRSVERALEAAATTLGAQLSAGLSVVRTHDAETVRDADKIVVPGQGGFGECVRSLEARHLDEVIRERIAAGTPYLGICLGLQCLFESSPEAPGVPGLGVIPGHCQQLKPEPGIKVPHMGWNQLSLQNGGHPTLERAGGDGTWVYFVHSFHAVPTDETAVRATVQHGTQKVTAAVARDNVIATQFHPEKSQEVGIALLRGFLAL